MRFRHLQLRVQTTDGPYGASLEFKDGLVVIWADNSMGKSTCLRSLIIALGLEAMLTYSQADLPLPPAVKSRLDSETGEYIVLESEVYLELENAKGQRIVTQRTVKGRRDKNLITVYFGPVLSEPNSVATVRDFFINRDGGATREHGFHHFLAEFLGWDLPKVQSYDGSERLLYLQCIFPYFVVEQTRGWSTLQPPIPTHFRIRDCHKRAVEFLLNLDAHRVALKRQELISEKSQIESAWKSQVSRATVIAEMTAGAIQSLPRLPVVDWPPKVPPQIVVPAGEQWIQLLEKVEHNRAGLSNLVESEIPRVQEIASAAEGELIQAESLLRHKQTLLSRLMGALDNEQEEVKRLEHRLSAIAEDIQRHKDVKTLQSLGSRKESELDNGHCPICHQVVQDSLLPIVPDQVVMSLDENIEFLTEQKRTFELVFENAKRIAIARLSQVKTLNQELGALRDHIRSLRQTLVSDARLPSIAAIRSRIELESAIRRDEQYLYQFSRALDSFRSLSEQWRDNQIALQSLPRDDVTTEDKDKINGWTKLIRNQLAQFGFRSFSPAQVNVSQDTYRPEHDGFDLQADASASEPTPAQLQNSISASDLIRTIWSYLHGLLELARTTKTNHPGCLIFDEPRQQSTRDVSFAELLKRASESGSAGQQVIFFTSENFDRLKQHLDGLPHSLIAIKGRVLKRQS